MKDEEDEEMIITGIPPSPFSGGEQENIEGLNSKKTPTIIDTIVLSSDDEQETPPKMEVGVDNTSDTEMDNAPTLPELTYQADDNTKGINIDNSPTEEEVEDCDPLERSEIVLSSDSSNDDQINIKSPNRQVSGIHTEKQKDEQIHNKGQDALHEEPVQTEYSQIMSETSQTVANILPAPQAQTVGRETPQSSKVVQPENKNTSTTEIIQSSQPHKGLETVKEQVIEEDQSMKMPMNNKNIDENEQHKKKYHSDKKMTSPSMPRLMAQARAKAAYKRNTKTEKELKACRKLDFDQSHRNQQVTTTNMIIEGKGEREKQQSKISEVR
jgi:hypothetical protein